MKFYCNKCSKVVSSEVPDGSILRAHIECPECVLKENDTIKYYGLRNKDTGKIQTFYTETICDEVDVGDIIYHLIDMVDGVKDKIWMVPKREMAENVVKENSKWYNATYESPMYRLGTNLVVIEIDVKIV